LKNRRYQEEIDDLREWGCDEAAHRIADNIKRLNRSGITNIRLERCRLVRANLERVNLREADLSGAEGWTNKQWVQAASLVGATLPDRTTMTEEDWEEFKKRYDSELILLSSQGQNMN
jgi:hypothetical protein